jgi:hypothetical protein
LPRGNLGHSIDIASHTVATTGGPRSLATAGKPALMDQLKIRVAEPGTDWRRVKKDLSADAPARRVPANDGPPVSMAACGPNAIPMATARLSSTTGEGISWASPS